MAHRFCTDCGAQLSPFGTCTIVPAHTGSVATPPPESDFCSRCHDHSEAVWQDGMWLSACCTRPFEAVDVEPPEDWR